ncbi:hypothetical protein ACS0TY_026252 [Phlomoides rotata]
MGGTTAVLAKSAAAPIERVKLLLQNQGELIKRGQLQRAYIGVGDCFKRVFRQKGILPFWRGNKANVLRYFPTHVPSYHFWFSECFHIFQLAKYPLLHQASSLCCSILILCYSYSICIGT